MKPPHRWMWMDYYGEIHATDIYTCTVCGKTVHKTGNREPVPGKCKGAGAVDASIVSQLAGRR